VLLSRAGLLDEEYGEPLNVGPEWRIFADSKLTSYLETDEFEANELKKSRKCVFGIDL
jgi:hypothetical protein